MANHQIATWLPFHNVAKNKLRFSVVAFYTIHSRLFPVFIFSLLKLTMRLRLKMYQGQAEYNRIDKYFAMKIHFHITTFTRHSAESLIIFGEGTQKKREGKKAK